VHHTNPLKYDLGFNFLEFWHPKNKCKKKKKKNSFLFTLKKQSKCIFVFVCGHGGNFHIDCRLDSQVEADEQILILTIIVFK